MQPLTPDAQPGRRDHVLTLALATGLFALISAARLAVGTPEDGLGLLYTIPVAIVGLKFGARAGLAAAAVGFGLFVVWTVLEYPEITLLGYLTRAVLLVLVGTLTGRIADRLRMAAKEADLLVRSAPDAIIQVTADGRIVLANPQVEQLFGYQRGELAGRSVDTLVPDRLRAAHGGHRDRYATTPRTRPMGQGLELHGRRKDGTEFPVEISLSPLEGRHGSAVMAIIRDVSERRQAEGEIRRAARYFEVSRELLCTLSPDGRLLRLNGSWEPAVGWEPDEITSRPLAEFLHEEDRRPATELISRLAATQETGAISTRFRTRGGSWRWLDWVATGDADGLVYASARDVTDRKRIEAELELHSEIVSTMSEGVVLADAATATVVYANPRFEEMLGYERGQLEGLPVAALTAYGDDSAERIEAITRALEQDGEWSGELPNRRADCTEFWSSVRASGFDHPERGRLWVAVHADITERKQIEAEREQALREHVRSNADLEQFGYVVSHDLSEPLRVISGFAELLEESYAGQLDADGDRFLRAIRTGAGRMQALIDGLLIYSRVGHGTLDRTIVDSGRVVEQSLEALGTLISESGAMVELGDLPEIEAEPRLLGQVFQNLISNAIKFANGGVPDVHVSARREPGAWRFCISDNGPGVDPRHAQRIFDVFQRLHGREVEGTGIGLAISKRIVERHGGRISVEPRAAGGSVFSFTIPDAGADAAKPPPAVETPPAQSPRHARRGGGIAAPSS